jgi:hypothetical protein
MRKSLEMIFMGGFPDSFTRAVGAAGAVGQPTYHNTTFIEVLVIERPEPIGLLFLLALPITSVADPECLSRIRIFSSHHGSRVKKHHIPDPQQKMLGKIVTTL